MTTNAPAAHAPEALSSLDASFLYLERPTELLHVGALAILAATPSFEAFTATIGERLDRLPRYRQVPERPFFDLRLPVWRDDPAYDVRRHVHRTAVPAPGDERALHAVVDRLFATPLADDRPLWECHLLEGLAGGRAALLLKIHHCMIDGVSGVQVLELLTTPLAPAPAPSAAERDGASSGWLASALGAASHPLRTVERVRGALVAGGALAGTVLRPAEPFPWNGVLGGRRAVRWQQLDLDRLFAMRAAAGCKINDVALAVITGALRSIVPPVARTPGRRPCALVPVSVRSAADHLALGNRISGRLAFLPLDVSDPLERLRMIADDMRGQKAGGGLQAFDVALAAASVLPAAASPVLAWFHEQRPVVHTICTNVPGPAEPRQLAGVPILAVHPIVPLAMGIGIAFAMLSYAGGFSITVTADPALVPAIDGLPAALAAAAEELAASLGLGTAAAAPPATLTVGELMTPAVVTVAPEARLGVAWNVMRARRIRHLPVVDGAGALRGLVTHRDLLAALPSALGADAGTPASVLAFGRAEVRDVMETHLGTTTPAEPAAAAGRRMARQKIGCLLVVGPHGELVGIVTEQDFLRWAVEHMAA
jgi:WS/DGAT/MGAT family acyltransferase